MQHSSDREDSTRRADFSSELLSTEKPSCPCEGASTHGRDWFAYLPALKLALAREGHMRLMLRGSSMSPTLPDVCEIDVAPVPARPTIGSLIVFAGSDGLIAHRLVGRRRHAWITQGDGRRRPDPPLAQAQLLGRVVAAFCGGRQCWPARYERSLSVYWIARYYFWRVARVGVRLLRQLRPA